ncbi:phage tail sheath family protein [Trinickia soli]|uniref:Phage tail protein n=1 Tax=Trinickia soli TaxID=380675 RepID=A0A2N7W3S6_9BURK|nr:phage tail sheath C-terminal domain-containing protein [Trinickia soli]PMS24051.1 hypothetical protein C0Z19_14560 [Trinickia soli]CAB3701508.1 hypothetical protein LMG24076_03447 [Trinickia soli]
MSDVSNLLHPGVYIKELPGLPSMTGASTSIPVFIGATERLADGDRNVARPVRGWADYQARYGSFVFGAQVGAAVFEFFALGGAFCYVIGVADDPPPTVANFDLSDPFAKLHIAAASMGDWPNDLVQVVTLDAGPAPAAGKAANTFTLNVVVDETDLAASSSVWAKLLKVYITTNAIKPTPIGPASQDNFYILESYGAFNAASLNPPAGASTCPLQDQVNAKSMFIRVQTVDTSEVNSGGDRSSTLVKFANGDTVTYNAAFYGPALKAVSAVPDATLIAIPDAAIIDMSDLDPATAATAAKPLKDVISSVFTAFKHLPNMFYVIDSPYVDIPSDTQNIVDFVTGGTDNLPVINDHAAIYYPYIVVLNPISGYSVPVPPSGAVLGLYANTDMNAGVWVSPAGVVNGRVTTATALTGWLSESDQDTCNPHGINVIRPISGYGITIYGARTLNPGTQTKYVSVRRFLTYVEQTIKAGLQWVVFQNITEILYTTVVRETTAFLTSLWNMGALYGATVDQAFFVTCDDTNNPPDQRAKGILNIAVGLAVLSPAEFVVVTISQITGSPSSGS